jgi:hypothetical protein
MTPYTCQTLFDFLTAMRIEHDEAHSLGTWGNVFDPDILTLNVRLAVESGASSTYISSGLSCEADVDLSYGPRTKI